MDVSANLSVLNTLDEYNWQIKKLPDASLKIFKKNSPGSFYIKYVDPSSEKISVSAPIPNSNYNYISTFNKLEYSEANKYIIKHIQNYESRNYQYLNQLPTAPEFDDD